MSEKNKKLSPEEIETWLRQVHEGNCCADEPEDPLKEAQVKVKLDDKKDQA